MATEQRSNAHRGWRHLFVRDLVLGAKIGVHTHERQDTQPVRINVDLSVAESVPIGDDLANVVCYEEIVEAVKAIIAAGHINLVETLAERIAETCLVEPRVMVACVRVEKLDVIAEAASVGVEIERIRQP